MKRSWICAAAVVFQRMAGARRVSSIRTSVVSILFVGIVLLFSQTIRSQTIRQRSHDVKNGERLYKSEPTAGARRRR